MDQDDSCLIITFDQKSFHKSKWPSIELPWSSSKQLADRQRWIYTNIPEKHVIWFIDQKTVTYKFRYERDYLWFRLTWS